MSEKDDSGRALAFAQHERMGPILYRFRVVGRILYVASIWFVVGASVTTITNFYRGTGNGDYGNQVSAVAEVGDCRRSGPVSTQGFGYWWTCDVTVRRSDGRVSQAVVDHSTVTPDDAGRPVPFAVICDESGGDCRYGRPTAFIWGLLVQILRMVHAAVNMGLLFFAGMFLVDLVVGPRRYYALLDRLQRRTKPVT